MESSPYAHNTYEFGAHENAVIGATEGWIRRFSWIAIGGGILMGLGGAVNLPTGFTNMILGVIYVMIGMSCRRAADAFGNVVRTQGSDLDHLMAALRYLGAAFKTMVILVAVTVVAILIIGTLVAIGLRNGTIPTS